MPYMTFRKTHKGFIKSKIAETPKILVSAETSTATLSKRWKLHDQVGLQ